MYISALPHISRLYRPYGFKELKWKEVFEATPDLRESFPEVHDEDTVTLPGGLLVFRQSVSSFIFNCLDLEIDYELRGEG